MTKRVPAFRIAVTTIAMLTAAACTTTSGEGRQGGPTVTRTVSRASNGQSPRSPSTSGLTAPAAITSAAKAPSSWASTFRDVSTGVVRIDDICDDDGTLSTGTGFLIAANLVATVAHVVEGQGALRVTSPTSGLVEPAVVIGLDHADDLALLQTAGPLPGHVFTLARHSPAIGTEMAAIGFPLAQSMQLTIGHITGTHDHRNVGGEFDLSDVLLSDAALNPGNSGGPWITRSGQVIALAESGPPFDEANQAPAQGNKGGVSIADASSDFSSWRARPSPQTNRGCQPADSVAAAIETLQLYFYEINQSDYASAYAQLYSDNHPISGLGGFIAGVRSSTDTAADGSDAAFSVVRSGQSEGHVYLDVRFRSHQHAAQGPNGETCTDWTLRYMFRPFDSTHRGLQLIYLSPPTPGTGGHRPC